LNNRAGDGLSNGSNNAPTEAALAAVDDIARRGMAWAAPMRFGPARTPADREASFRLRYRAVVERGWHRPEEFPGGLEHDAYDADAVHLIGWDGDVPAATARLIFPSAHRPLPTEEAFGLRIEPVSQVVGAGRFVVARSHSNIEHRTLAGLMGVTWLTVRALGFDHVCSAFASGSSLRMYRRMGIKLTVLAPARHYWGEERYPIRWDAVDSAGILRERWRKLSTVASL
jgi:hypothetical protein